MRYVQLEEGEYPTSETYTNGSIVRAAANQIRITMTITNLQNGDDTLRIRSIPQMPGLMILLKYLRFNRILRTYCTLEIILITII